MRPQTSRARRKGRVADAPHGEGVQNAAGAQRRARILWFDGLAVERRNSCMYHVLQRLLDGELWIDVHNDPVLAGPWFIYGPAQCGKTHLARALTAHWNKQNQQPSVCTTATEFACAYADAVDNRRLHAWGKRCATLGLLVIDDLHCLPDRQDVQRELVRLLEQFSNRRALLVVTSRLELTECEHLPADLVSRLQAGLSLELTVPRADARLGLVERLATQAHIVLEPRAARALAYHPWSNVPELIEAIDVLARTTAVCKKGTFASGRCNGIHGQSQRVLGEQEVRRRLGLRQPRHAASLRRIAQRTARHFRLPLAELKGPSRRRAVTTARGVAAYLARQLTGCSLEAIGEFLGGRDHTTILHACQQTEQLSRQDAAVREAIKELTRMLSRW